MQTIKLKQNHPTIEKRRINISSKRQITIPAKFFNALNLDKELDCIYSNGMLILTPVGQEDSAFAEEILEDLIQQGFSGEKLLVEFKNVTRKIRPAVEKLIEDADKIAEVASTIYHDPTSEIFGNENLED